jgi:hypothetical protein
MNKQIVKTVWFGELPPYPVESFTYRNEQVRVVEIQREIAGSWLQTLWGSLLVPLSSGRQSK